jgi:exodeoxyribonuclease V beta subunit
MAQDAGERKCTNLLHLSEVLQQASMDKKLGMVGLVKWLSEQRNPQTPRLDEYQMRLERDEAAVKIVTIHRSKGLEYPVVFCPFAWDGSRIRGADEPFTFHDQNDAMRLTIDLGSANRVENRITAEIENLAENLRLVYVAMTRAKQRCYFVWGCMNDTETSAPAYLFHGRKDDREDAVSATARRFEGLTDTDILHDLKCLVGKADGAMELSYMPVGPSHSLAQKMGACEDLVCRHFSGTIDCSWKVTSFSSLVSGAAYHEDTVDHDTEAGLALQERMALSDGALGPGPKNFFDFPKGSGAGNFVHDVFENLDFVEDDFSRIERLVGEKLREHGFDESWKDATCRMIDKVLSVSLEMDRPDFTLSRIQNRDRLNELSFYFPINLLSQQNLHEVLGEHFFTTRPLQFPESLENLSFSPVKGFMRGFIDMVFQFEGRYYIVDWKSNHLGDSGQDYGQFELAGAMAAHYYYFQYLLYTVALHQYLGLRVAGYTYEKDFGAIYYVFVRGVDGDVGPQYGVFRDRPSAALVEKLTECLLARETY